MNRHFQSLISALALIAMLFSGVVTIFSVTASPAFSKSSNANENSGRGASDKSDEDDDDDDDDDDDRDSRRNSRDNNSRGAVASSLGALNAAHANANARANAAANSRVGMIAIYKLAVEATAEASDALDDAKLALETFVMECGEGGSMLDATVTVEVVDAPDIEVSYCENILNEAAASNDGVDNFNAETYVEWLDGAVKDAEISAVAAKGLEDTALEAAANKVTNEDVVAALWDLLEPPTR